MGSLVDFWMNSFLTQTPSPVPSCSSADDTVKPEPHFSLDYAIRLLGGQSLWQPSFTNLLAFYQLQQQQQHNMQQLLSPISDVTQLYDPPDPSLPKPIPLREIKQNVKDADAAPLPRKRPAEKTKHIEDADVKRQKTKRQTTNALDEVTASPVSGMFIKEEISINPSQSLEENGGQLDETAAYVYVSEESRKQISAIPNVIGDCVCSLCRVKYEDVFQLAQHKCPRIAHHEYKCPECEKVFSCPANLASHRRWHRPRDTPSPQVCSTCSQTFPSKKNLKAHQAQCMAPPTSSEGLGLGPALEANDFEPRNIFQNYNLLNTSALTSLTT